MALGRPSCRRSALGWWSSSLMVATTALFGVAAVPYLTVSEIVWIACSPVSAVGCDLIFLQGDVQYDPVSRSGKVYLRGLPSLMGSIEGPEDILLSMEARRAVCFWFILSSAWCR